MFLLPLPPMWPNTVQLWWWQPGTQHCCHSDDVLEAAVHWGFPEPHLPLQEQRGLHGRLNGQPEEGRAAAGLQRRGDQSRRQQPLHLQRVGGRLHGKTTEMLPNGVSFPVNVHRCAEFNAVPWIVLVYAISPRHCQPSPALPVISPISQTIYFSAISQQVTGRLTAVLFFFPPRRNTQDSGARQWSSTDRRRPLVCPLWTLPPLTLAEQIRSSESKSAQSASCKDQGIEKKRETRGETKKKYNERGAHSR